MPTLAGNKHISVHLSFHGPRPLNLSREKYGSNPSEIYIKVVIPASTQKIITYTKVIEVLQKRKFIKDTSENE